MATSSMIPYSNPAGNNQTSPASIIGTSGPGVGTGSVGIPVNNPVQPTQAAQQNPLIPTGAGTTQAPGAAQVAAPGAVGSDPTGQLYQQLTDIYGPGVGASLNTLLSSIGGVDSATLQQYIASLQPQMAKAGADLHASLGAGGVSANSSVQALGEANLEAQEQGAIAGESANLLQSGQNLEASILEHIAPTAAQQVSDSSPLNVLGQVLGAGGSLVSDFMGLSSITGGISKGIKSFGGASGVPASVPASGTSDWGLM